VKQYRSLYATVLKDWFGLPASDITAVLGATFSTIPFVVTPTSNQPLPTTPDTKHLAVLEDNYPDPFRHQTLIRFTLHQALPITLQVYDIQGRLLQTLIDEIMPAGNHQVSFIRGILPAGVYLYTLTTPQHTQSRKMIII